MLWYYLQRFRFEPQRFATLYGLGIFAAGIFGLIEYPLYSIMYNWFDSDPFWVKLLFMIAHNFPHVCRHCCLPFHYYFSLLDITFFTSSEYISHYIRVTQARSCRGHGGVMPPKWKNRHEFAPPPEDYWQHNFSYVPVSCIKFLPPKVRRKGDIASPPGQCVQLRDWCNLDVRRQDHNWVSLWTSENTCISC